MAGVNEVDLDNVVGSLEPETTFSSDDNGPITTKVPVVIQAHSSTTTHAPSAHTSTDGKAVQDQVGSASFAGGGTAPLNKASTVSRWLFLWISPLMKYGYRHRIDLEDVYDLPGRQMTTDIMQ